MVSEAGADFVINHHEDFKEQFDKLGIAQPEFVFSTSHSDTYLTQIAGLIVPQGRFVLIDDPKSFDINPFKGKSVSVHWEFMFTRSLRGTADIAKQGEILSKMAILAQDGKIKTTLTHTLKGLNATTLKQAHAMVEKGDMIGKVVVAV